jgi:hypothetical protein
LSFRDLLGEEVRLFMTIRSHHKVYGFLDNEEFVTTLNEIHASADWREVTPAEPRNGYVVYVEQNDDFVQVAVVLEDSGIAIVYALEF